MYLWEKSYKWVMDNAVHLEAIGQTEISIGDDGAPWGKATRVEASGCYRFNGPVGARIIVDGDPITVSWNVDFEARDANGHGVSLFDRDRLRDVMRKLSPMGRHAFARLLEAEVMPDLQKRTLQIRDSLNKQTDSEDCVRGLIAFADKLEDA